MSTRREAGAPCPLGEEVVGMDLCRRCRFFRGASFTRLEGLRVVCNWPRNGSEIAGSIPDAFRLAFAGEGTDV